MFQSTSIVYIFTLSITEFVSERNFLRFLSKWKWKQYIEDGGISD